MHAMWQDPALKADELRCSSLQTRLGRNRMKKFAYRISANPELFIKWTSSKKYVNYNGLKINDLLSG